MYPGLSSLLQQLAADPSDELLASRIVSLLQDIPDGEYKVDQLLAAAQMLLAVSPRLALICSHAAFRSAPERLESLAIAEEALARMGRRAKVQVLRQERIRLESAAQPRIEINATVSRFLDAEEKEPVEATSLVGVVSGPGEPVAGSGDATVVLTGMPDPGSPAGAQPTSPQWWSVASSDAEFKADIENWRSLMDQGAGMDALLQSAVQKADLISKLKDEALLAAVEGIPDDLLLARMTGVLVVDALMFTVPPVDQAQELATDIMARLLAWHVGDQSPVASGVRQSIGIRLKRLTPALQEGIARALREQSRSGRPDPTFSTTTL